ncbi:hypothetical protein ElyMa_000358500 [Elysia marginata]|uniref:WH2 domain-containing protein n=1 Tax=Elysia marginata TaxID=1093978 RepID=A0AAV4FH22_9GAST|nr:hypothetical protein ElyMa_000358500 [Elysia marginata]
MQSELLAHINGIFSGRGRRKSELPDNGGLDAPDKTSGIRFRRKSETQHPVTTTGMKIPKPDSDSKSNRFSLVQVAKLNLKRLSIGEDVPPKLPARHFSTDSEEELPPPIPERICSLEMVVDAEFQGRFAFRPISTVPLPEVFAGTKKTYPSKAPKKKGLQRPPSEPPPPPPPPLDTSSSSPTSPSPTSQPLFFLGPPPPPVKNKQSFQLGELNLLTDTNENVYNGFLETPVAPEDAPGSAAHGNLTNGCIQHPQEHHPGGQADAGNGSWGGSDLIKQKASTPIESTTIVVGKPKIPQKPQKLGALDDFIGNSQSREKDPTSVLQPTHSPPVSSTTDGKPSLARLTSFTVDSEEAILPFIEKARPLSASSIKRHVERSINPASQAPQVPVHTQSVNQDKEKPFKKSPNLNLKRQSWDDTSPKISTKSELVSKDKRKQFYSYHEQNGHVDNTNDLASLPPPLPPRPPLPSLGKPPAVSTVSKSGVGSAKPSLGLPPKPAITNGIRPPNITDGKEEMKDFHLPNAYLNTSAPLPPPPPPPPLQQHQLPTTDNTPRIPSPPLPPPPPSPPPIIEMSQQPTVFSTPLPLPPAPPPPPLAQDKPLPPPPPLLPSPLPEPLSVSTLTNQNGPSPEVQLPLLSPSKPYSLLSMSTSSAPGQAIHNSQLPPASPDHVRLPSPTAKNNGWGGQDIYDPLEEEGDPYDTVNIYKL